ncbi:BA75_03911T0 [Komagataella pastoris]|uniref:BA75_03911T0 n=1 Tax=Komagataella pastoris TaxID=4922 RepID=A0A1B2JFB3_PICPA|nr:BA75_03911T0 [Komagataella pastoris]
MSLSRVARDADGVLYETLISAAKRDTGDFSSQDNCVTCPDVPSCPTCKANEKCVLTARTCSTCPAVSCVHDENSGSSSSLSSAATGGISAGAVVGALVIFSVMGFLYFRYVYKPKKLRQQDEEANVVKDMTDDKTTLSITQKPGNSDLERRNSTLTLSTMASTILTKTSNIIPIAYIPGVMVSNSGRSNSTYSKSILSDDNFSSFHEDASIHNEKRNDSNTTTAIRAKPRLVNIAEEDDSSSIVELQSIRLAPIHRPSMPVARLNMDKQPQETTAGENSSDVQTFGDDVSTDLASSDEDLDYEDIQREHERRQKAKIEKELGSSKSNSGTTSFKTLLDSSQPGTLGSTVGTSTSQLDKKGEPKELDNGDDNTKADNPLDNSDVEIFLDVDIEPTNKKSFEGSESGSLSPFDDKYGVN